MAVDENNVWNIVEITLSKHKSGGCCAQVCAAWQELYNRRNFTSTAYDPVELAIAEHYLYARCKVCSGEYSQTQMNAMVRGYHLAKQQSGLRNLLKSNPDNPTSPPTEEAVSWGLTGAANGETDRVRCNLTASPPLFRMPKFFKKKTGYE
jgi:hypothetical protein